MRNVLTILLLLVSVTDYGQLKTDLISYWLFDETSGTTANDTVGTNDGTLVGNSAFTTGKIGNCLTLDGTNDYVYFTGYNGYTKSHTFAAWVKIGNADHDFIVFGAVDNGSEMGFNDANKLFYRREAWSTIVSSTTSAIAENTWSLVVVSYEYVDGTHDTARFSLNGSAYEEIVSVNNPQSVVTNRFGRPNDGGASYEFDGEIDAAGIWEKVLSEVEVDSLYNAGAGLQYPFDTPDHPVIVLGYRMYIDGVEYYPYIDGDRYNKFIGTIPADGTVLRDLIHPQTFYTHDSVNVNDIVGEVNPNPDSCMKLTTGETYTYTITDTSDLWTVDGGYIKCVSTAGLQTGVTYGITLRADAGAYYDDETVSIYVYDADDLRYVDFDAAGDGDGTFLSPRNKVVTAMADSIYAYKRGTDGTTTSLVDFAENSGMIAYGVGTKPIVRANYTANDYAMYIGPGEDNIKIQSIDFRSAETSRVLQISAVSPAAVCANIWIDNITIGGAEGGSVPDIGIRSDTTVNYITITNCTLDSFDSDAIYLHAKYADVGYNKITEVSIANTDGDAVQITSTTYKSHIHHNYINIGNTNCRKGAIALVPGGDLGGPFTGELEDVSRCIVEYNYCLMDQANPNFGMDTHGMYDTVRYNLFRTTTSATNGIAINIDEGGFVAYNVFDGFDIGAYTRGADDLKLYNNLFLNIAHKTIDNNTASAYAIYVKNNIFYGANDTLLYSHATSNPELDYNLWYSSSGTVHWILDGSTYTSFATYQDPYDTHGLWDTPDYSATYYPTVGGNLIDAGVDLDILEDFIGVTVGASPDVGIYEYSP